VGLVLLYQNATNHWESWAYAWALVGPAASGLGLALWGIRSERGEDVRRGTWGFLGGLGLFAIGFLFFEGVIGIGGERFEYADWLLPVTVIGVGAVLVIRGLLDRREPDSQS
jgi:peptidoglycan/LPS O-acetylase OafA/YrhL